jgi:alanine dehydrogenase
MVIGVPRETHRHERRVGLNPFAVSRLASLGHTVFVENDAGAAARFADSDYQAAGATIVYSREEAYRRADLLCRVGSVPADEIELVRPGSTLCGFQHLAVAPREIVGRLAELEVTVIGYEITRDEFGGLPVLIPFSEMGGRMAVHLAAYYLQNETGGRGVLLGNVPGVPPPTVLILGAGSVGQAAARQTLANGCHAIVLDENLAKLRRLDRELSGRCATAVVAKDRLEQYTAIADVVIGAVLIPGARAPFVVNEEMVRAMKPGSVIVDVSIDQGGCVQTSRPTTLDEPTFVMHDVVHYCVPNMTANIARTASRALSSAALPYIEALAVRGVEEALRSDDALAAGVYLFRGTMVHRAAGEALNIPATPLLELLREGPRR